jgi:hypothetical protein
MEYLNWYKKQCNSKNLFTFHQTTIALFQHSTYHELRIFIYFDCIFSIVTQYILSKKHIVFFVYITVILDMLGSLKIFSIHEIIQHFTFTFYRITI